MSDRRRRRAIWHTLMLLAVSTVSPSVLYAQSRAVGIPEHASASTYGTGWECDRGYQRVNGACAAIELPANAFLTIGSFGRGWECMRGYRARERTCIAIDLPPHAYLDSSGDRWQCERGYRTVAETCVALDVPPHAHLDASGDRWECERGYRSARDSCVAIRVPSNGYPTNASTDSVGLAIAAIERSPRTARPLTYR